MFRPLLSLLGIRKSRSPSFFVFPPIADFFPPTKNESAPSYEIESATPRSSPVGSLLKFGRRRKISKTTLCDTKPPRGLRVNPLREFPL